MKRRNMNDLTNFKLHYLKSVKEGAGETYKISLKSAQNTMGAVNGDLTVFSPTNSIRWNLGNYAPETPYHSLETAVVNFAGYEDTELARIFVEATGKTPKEKGGIVIKKTAFPPPGQMFREGVNTPVSNDLYIQQIEIIRQPGIAPDPDNFQVKFKIFHEPTASKIYAFNSVSLLNHLGYWAMVLCFTEVVMPPGTPVPATEIAGIFPVSVPQNIMSNFSPLSIIFFPNITINLGLPFLVKKGMIRVDS